jgi:hypothetical protein
VAQQNKEQAKNIELYALREDLNEMEKLITENIDAPLLSLQETLLGCKSEMPGNLIFW